MSESQTLWTRVDRYVVDLLVGADAALKTALVASTAAGLPAIQVTPTQGMLLNLLARTQGARSILEIGTLGGYSTLWLAKALPDDGELITLESDPKHAEVARANFTRAGLADRIELQLGNAHETLPQLAEDRRGPFDLVFIDADKPSTPDYLEWALRLTTRGSLIVLDNVVREGKLADADSADPNVRGMQRALERLAGEPRVMATVIQTVGEKGYDGFAIVRVMGDR